MAVMGSRGPIPKRSEERVRRNKADGTLQAVTLPGGPARPPAADKSWHPIAKRMWKALKQSGQARFFEASDWAFAYSLMDDLSHYKDSKKRSGQMLATIMTGMGSLLMTEGDRRRAQIELRRVDGPEPSDRDKVLEMSEWRERLRARA